MYWIYRSHHGSDFELCQDHQLLINFFFCLVFTCEPGSYLDVNNPKLECKKCPVGHYSVGGGVRFSDWRKLPVGFEVHSTELRYHGYGYDNEFSKEKGVNCSKYVVHCGSICSYFLWRKISVSQRAITSSNKDF